MMEDEIRIDSIQITETISDEPTDFESTFHYRIGKELEVGIDYETGEHTEAFCKVTLNHANPIDYEHFHKNVMRKQVAMGEDSYIQFIHPITKEEYEKEGE